MRCRPFRRRPSDRQLARFIEERDPELDDVVVTAVDYAQASDASARMRELWPPTPLALWPHSNLDAVVSRARPFDRPRTRGREPRRCWQLAFAFFATAMSRATSVASAYLFPARLTVEVTPGRAKVRAGQPLTITARVGGRE